MRQPLGAQCTLPRRALSLCRLSPCFREKLTAGSHFDKLVALRAPPRQGRSPSPAEAGCQCRGGRARQYTRGKSSRRTENTGRAVMFRSPALAVCAVEFLGLSFGKHDLAVAHETATNRCVGPEVPTAGEYARSRRACPAGRNMRRNGSAASGTTLGPKERSPGQINAPEGGRLDRLSGKTDRLPSGRCETTRLAVFFLGVYIVCVTIRAVGRPGRGGDAARPDTPRSRTVLARNSLVAAPLPTELLIGKTRR